MNRLRCKKCESPNIYQTQDKWQTIICVNCNNGKLYHLLQKNKEHIMSDEERWNQRISFVYGNTKMSNPHITRKMVEDVAKKFRRPKL